MARMARIVVPDCPHHATRRGNRRQRTCFSISGHARHLAFVAAFSAPSRLSPGRHPDCR